MKERRKHQRQKPKKYPTVYNFYTGKPIGLLANLSSAGGMIITPGPIKTSTTFPGHLPVRTAHLALE